MHPWHESSKFEQRYAPEPNTGCWLWTAARDKDGYGVVHPEGKRGKQWRAHRLAYLLFRGDIPDGLQVCHHCDTPSCVNPDHLFLGTNEDNVHDMVRKGRDGFCGVKNGRAKLSPETAEELRWRHIKGMSLKGLAAFYDLSTAQVWRVICKKVWT